MSNDRKSGWQNHYDKLGLKQDCSEKEVKNAFLTLSKAHHPDLHPNDPTQQQKFVEIYEAYSVLSRPGKRAIYDSNLHLRERTAQHRNASRSTVESDAPYYYTFRDESIWNMRNKTSENFDPNKPYYGIKGINKVSNYWIAGGAVVVMLVGALFHYTAFKHSAVFTVTQLDTKDERIARDLFRVRKTAERNGNETQIELLKERFGWDEKATGDK